MKPYLYFLMGLSLFVLGCQKDIELDVPGQEPKIVLNGVVMADSVLRVHLSQSRFVLDVGPLSNIENAALNLYEDGQQVGSWANIGYGVYEVIGFKPQAGRTYRVQASAPGFDPVSVETRVPAPMSGVQIVAVDSTFNESNGYADYKVRLRLIDPAQSTDFYMISRLTRKSDSWGGDGKFKLGPLESTAPNVISACGDVSEFSSFLCRVLLNDRTFEGKDREFVVNFQNWEQGQNYLVVSKISEDLYKHMISRNHNFMSDGNPFAEPVPIFMNVDGGFGILGSSTSSWHKIP